MPQPARPADHGASASGSAASTAHIAAVFGADVGSDAINMVVVQIRVFCASTRWLHGSGRLASLCVPETSSTSRDQAIFADQATDAGLFADVVLIEIDRLG